MVDTYGAGLDEIRGFVDGGWAVCRNKEGITIVSAIWK